MRGRSNAHLSSTWRHSKSISVEETESRERAHNRGGLSALVEIPWVQALYKGYIGAKMANFCNKLSAVAQNRVRRMAHAA